MTATYRPGRRASYLKDLRLGWLASDPFEAISFTIPGGR